MPTPYPAKKQAAQKRPTRQVIEPHKLSPLIASILPENRSVFDFKGVGCKVLPYVSNTGRAVEVPKTDERRDRGYPKRA